MLGPVRLMPAILFYLLYVAAIVIFVSGAPEAGWQSSLLYGALFDFFCYMTFERADVAVAAQALDLAGRRARRRLGDSRDGCLRSARVDHGQRRLVKTATRMSQ